MYDEKAKKRILKYQKKLKTITLRMKQEEYEPIEKFAKDSGYKSMRQFILDSIHEKMQRR